MPRASIAPGFSSINSSEDAAGATGRQGGSSSVDYSVPAGIGAEIFGKVREWAQAELELKTQSRVSQVKTAANAAAAITATNKDRHTQGPLFFQGSVPTTFGQDINDDNYAANGRAASPHADTHPGQSIYILVEKERKKYQGMLERMNEENKRKQGEIGQLRHDLNIVKEVLALAGLKFDIKELQNIVMAQHQHGGGGGGGGVNSSRLTAPLATSNTAAAAAAAAAATITTTRAGNQKPDLKNRIPVLPPISKVSADLDQERGGRSAIVAAAVASRGEGVHANTLSTTTIPEELSEIPIVRLQSTHHTHDNNPPVHDGIAPPSDQVPDMSSSKIRSTRYRIRMMAAGKEPMDKTDEVDETEEQEGQSIHNTQRDTLHSIEAGHTGTASATQAIPAMQLYNQNLDYNHRAQLHYGDYELEPVESEIGEEDDGFIERAPTEMTISSTTHQRRHVRVPSNTASILSGNTTLRSNDAQGDLSTVVPKPFALASSTVDRKNVSMALPPVRSPPGSPPGNANSSSVDRVFGSQGAAGAKQTGDSPKNTRKVGYVGRLIKSKIVRDRQWKEAKDRTM
eukprot:jgi/Hompol1/7111/HPOL_000654-RA